MTVFDRFRSFFSRRSALLRKIQQDAQRRQATFELLEDRRLMIATPAYFDFATGASSIATTPQPHEPMYLGRLYTPTRGYGYSAYGTNAWAGDFTTSGWSDAMSDYNSDTAPRTFQVDVPNGTYRVKVDTGHFTQAVSDTQITIENGTPENYSTATGETHTTDRTVYVADGQLNILLDDAGSSGDYWVVNAASVEAVNVAPNILNFAKTLLYQEGDPALHLLAGGTTVDDEENDMRGGSLTVSYVGTTGGNDRLRLTTNADTGSLAVSLTADTSTAYTGIASYSGNTFADFSGGIGASPLVVTFRDSAANSQALTNEAVQSLLRAVSFNNVNVNNLGASTRNLNFTLSDGQAMTVAQTLTLETVNDAPIIWALANKTIVHDAALGPISFTVTDIEGVAAVTLSGTSSNTALVPDANITFGGSGTSRTYTITPAANQAGTTTITVTANDHGTPVAETFSRSFTLTVTNASPTASTIADQTIVHDTSTFSLPFTVADADHAASSLTLSATSSNPTLIPVTGITFGGSGANRTVTLTRTAGEWGSATVSIVITDAAGGSISKTFNITAERAPSHWQDPDTYGDVNNDGYVSAEDADAIAAALAGESSLSILSGAQRPDGSYADVDGDWDVDSVDTAIINSILAPSGTPVAIGRLFDVPENAPTYQLMMSHTSLEVAEGESITFTFSLNPPLQPGDSANLRVEPIALSGPNAASYPADYDNALYGSAAYQYFFTSDDNELTYTVLTNTDSDNTELLEQLGVKVTAWGYQPTPAGEMPTAQVSTAVLALIVPPVDVDLEINNVLDPYEENPGVFVGWNEGNDPNATTFTDPAADPDLVPGTLTINYPELIYGNLTWSIPTGVRLWWQEAGAWVPVGPRTGYASGSTRPLYVEGLQDAFGQVVVTFTPNPQAALPGFDISYLTIFNPDLDAKKIQHNLANGDLADNLEETQGAYVPVNSDDDDYDAANVPDAAQVGAFEFFEENDLLPIVLHPVVPLLLGGSYTLTIPATVRIWQMTLPNDPPVAVTAATTFDATQETMLYVEGITQGAGEIKLNWSNGIFARANADRIKVNTFEWFGPLNVPGHAVYTYDASGGAAGAGMSKWITSAAGTVVGGFENTGTGTDDGDILWDGGPVWGKAVYQAHPDFVWDLDVNVVEVKVSGDGELDTKGSTPIQNPADKREILSRGDKPFTMIAKVVVEKIEGAPRAHAGGATRGAKFIDVGFIQNGTVVHQETSFADIPDIRRHKMQNGNWYLDTVLGSNAPWYDSEGAEGLLIAKGLLSATADVLGPTNLSVYDSPGVLATDMMEWAGKKANRFDLEVKFNMYLAVRTREDKNGSAEVFTQRAAEDWQFNGTGTVVDTAWTGLAGVFGNSPAEGVLALVNTGVP